WQLLLLAVLFCLSNVESKPSQVERIINGENARPKQFPYQAFYHAERQNGIVTLCGGTIIGKRTILTAAHCLDGRSGEIVRLKIYLGAVDISNSAEIGQQIVIVEAGSYVIHEEWDLDKFSNDIGLIKLPQDLEFNQYIQPAKLPEPYNLYADKTAVVSGWGKVKGWASTEHLQYTNVKTLSNEECKRIIRFNGKFLSHWLCVTPNEKRTCRGDSGGPLAERNPDGSSTVIGLVSFKTVTCSAEVPTIFTRVSYFLNWIAQHTNEP
ncbi:chymotrypsin-like, partial [Drosophila navojoa]|uniref:chymotrypsin-like n=1 Tax=Drosophila navojoa TaxID=7232 RepID=UPI0011BE38E5